MLTKLLFEALARAVSPSTDDDRTGFMESLRTLRSLSSAVSSQAGLYVQLAQLEWERERERLIAIFVMLIIVLFACWFLLVLGSALALVLAWHTEYRELAIYSLLGVYFVAIVLSLWRLKRLVNQGKHAFSSLREDLAADIAVIKREL